ncbi:cyclic nucleotide-binding domain-containing protein [Pararhodospirillum photometricum]|uniref:Cyclic nucleotide-binding domain (CNMP-BD) protein n=1 Tax=Pararhodospirillum photometricum DSM 122 TaxID=1150469 RepID=H6SRH4_PARPM|nr:cyclic nucleotide-binding domain-containing protein [Pararhodospirillum photometricum]CCG07503.1 Cyclic nucleotide-binding domain (CNMP-BD) protein [Pararhodospirillum photometricum DSM 122]
MAGPPLFQRRTYLEGTVLFRQGDPPDGVYMVESGLVEIVVRRIDGEEKILGTVGPGEMFGEMALIDDKPRMATARVALEAKLVLIPAAAFQAQLKTINPVMSRVMGQLTQRIRALATELSLQSRSE